MLDLSPRDRETLEKLVHAERERLALEREGGARPSDHVEDSTVTHFPDVDLTFGEWNARIRDLETLLA